ncbi:MAG: hypothetical protein LBB63_03035 [Holosporaceae bacterium]|jgi:hypothetical protein|nr:hypothetical protein [Holosporaceae bacterium]
MKKISFLALGALLGGDVSATLKVDPSVDAESVTELTVVRPTALVQLETTPDISTTPIAIDGKTPVALTVADVLIKDWEENKETPTTKAQESVTSSNTAKTESWFKRFIGCCCGDANKDGKIDEHDIVPGLIGYVNKAATVAEMINSGGKASQYLGTASEITSFFANNPLTAESKPPSRVSSPTFIVDE